MNKSNSPLCFKKYLFRLLNGFVGVLGLYLGSRFVPSLCGFFACPEFSAFYGTGRVETAVFHIIVSALALVVLILCVSFVFRFRSQRQVSTEKSPNWKLIIVYFLIGCSFSIFGGSFFQIILLFLVKRSPHSLIGGVVNSLSVSHSRY